MIVSRRPRRSTPFRHVTKNPSLQLLYFPHLQNRDACNSFRIRSYENCRVSVGPLNISTLKPAMVFFGLSLFLSHSCALFCTFLHSSKTQLFSSQAIPHSFTKTREWRTPRLLEDQNEPSNAWLLFDRRHPVSPSPSFDPRRLLPRRQFASYSHSFLLNYIDPILHRVGPVGHFPHFIEEPRSSV